MSLRSSTQSHYIIDKLNINTISPENNNIPKYRHNISFKNRQMVKMVKFPQLSNTNTDTNTNSHSFDFNVLRPININKQTQQTINANTHSLSTNRKRNASKIINSNDSPSICQPKAKRQKCDPKSLKSPNKRLFDVQILKDFDHFHQLTMQNVALPSEQAICKIGLKFVLKIDPNIANTKENKKPETTETKTWLHKNKNNNGQNVIFDFATKLHQLLQSLNRLEETVLTKNNINCDECVEKYHGHANKIIRYLGHYINKQQLLNVLCVRYRAMVAYAYYKISKTFYICGQKWPDKETLTEMAYKCLKYSLGTYVTCNKNAAKEGKHVLINKTVLNKCVDKKYLKDLNNCKGIFWMDIVDVLLLRAKIDLFRQRDVAGAEYCIQLGHNLIKVISVNNSWPVDIENVKNKYYNKYYALSRHLPTKHDFT